MLGRFEHAIKTQIWWTGDATAFISTLKFIWISTQWKAGRVGFLYNTISNNLTQVVTDSKLISRYRLLNTRHVPLNSTTQKVRIHESWTYFVIQLFPHVLAFSAIFRDTTYCCKMILNTITQIWSDFDRASSLICGNKMPTRCNRGFLLQILLLAQHVSGTTMPIIRSSRVCYVSGLQDAAASCKPDT